jgi:hypothetical protein
MQWSKDTQLTIRSHKSKDRQCNDQKKRINKDQQNITQKAKDWATQTPLKLEG